MIVRKQPWLEWSTNGALLNLSLYIQYSHFWCTFFNIEPIKENEYQNILPSLGVRRLSSINFSHFNLLLWNSSAKWTETWEEASMEGPL
jgi:hypothetical protein